MMTQSPTLTDMFLRKLDSIHTLDDDDREGG